MVHAFLILTHGNWGLLLEQVKRLAYGKNRIFIHIDKKSEIDFSDSIIIEILKFDNVVFVENRINVQWGSMRLVQASLELIKNALQFQDIDYLHLLSGQCFLVKSHDYLDNFFAKNRGSQFINFYEMPLRSSNGPSQKRFFLYHFHENFNPKSNQLEDKTIKTFNDIFRAAQYQFFNLGIKRKTPKNFPKKLLAGSAWWSISADCGKYVLDYIADNHKIYKRFFNTQLPDESFFQIIILNSHFQSSVIYNNLRFCKFKDNGSFAMEIQDDDVQNLKKEDIIFARKISQQNLQLISEL